MRTKRNLRLAAVVPLFAAALFAQTPALTPAALALKAKAQNVPEIPFDATPGFLKIPQNIYFGESNGIGTNSKGHIFVATQNQGPQLFEFDQKGTYLREIGQGLYGFVYLHVVRIDPQDNIWVVDEATRMVIKFSPDGRVAMVLGHRLEPDSFPSVAPAGPDQPYLFKGPTDVTWDPSGNIFVVEGYGSSRVVKYDKNGRFIASSGARGSGPGQFNTIHSVASDANGNIYVGDRGNQRIQVLDNDLTFKAQYDQVGSPWAVCISPGPHPYLFSSNSNPSDNLDDSIKTVTGEIYKMELDGTIVGKFGHAGKKAGEFANVHEIDCRGDGNDLLVSEIQAWRVQKVTLHPAGTGRPQ